MKMIKETLFDWKVMGWNAYVPVMASAIALVYSLAVKGDDRIVLSIFEILLPAFSAWWSIFIFQDLLDEPGGETLFSYPTSRWRLGMQRVAVFFLLEVVLIAVVLSSYAWITNRTFWSLIGLQLTVQSLFFAALGYFLMTLLKNCSWSMLVTATYVSFQILTRGTVFPWSNLYFFHIQLPSGSDMYGKLIVTSVIGLLLLFCGQLLMNRLQKFND